MNGVETCTQTSQVKDIMDAIEANQIKINRCLDPCTLIYIDLQETYKEFDEHLDKEFLVEHEFIFPEKIQLSKPVPVYTTWSILAEFGGWVGLFVGICVMDVVDYVLDLSYFKLFKLAF